MHNSFVNILYTKTCGIYIEYLYKNLKFVIRKPKFFDSRFSQAYELTIFAREKYSKASISIYYFKIVSFRERTKNRS